MIKMIAFGTEYHCSTAQEAVKILVLMRRQLEADLRLKPWQRSAWRNGHLYVGTTDMYRCFIGTKTGNDPTQYGKE